MSVSEKQLLRNHVRKLQSEAVAVEILEGSVAIRSHLEQFSAFQAASVVYGFAPLPGEPDWILDALPPDKVYAFPRVTGRHVDFFVAESLTELVPGAYGVREPLTGSPAPPPGLILVPGMAFDGQGHRLGRGRGFYDHILKTFPGYRLGVAFAKQLFLSVPFEPHDEPVHAILTECGVQLSGGGTAHHSHEARSEGFHRPGRAS
ncbi:MAG: 5-formyltetrahydrofolate cyclo-ligase [Terrimicrobiaceae bacterium]